MDVHAVRIGDVALQPPHVDVLRDSQPGLGRRHHEEGLRRDVRHRDVRHRRVADAVTIRPSRVPQLASVGGVVKRMLLFEQPTVSTAAAKQTRLVSTPTKWKPLMTVLSPSTRLSRGPSGCNPTAQITVPPCPDPEPWMLVPGGSWYWASIRYVVAFRKNLPPPVDAAMARIQSNCDGAVPSAGAAPTPLAPRPQVCKSRSSASVETIVPGQLSRAGILTAWRGTVAVADCLAAVGLPAPRPSTDERRVVNAARVGQE